MHPSSFDNMRKCYRRYIAGSALETRPALKVLDIGGADVNGSYAEIFSGPNIEYLGADIAAGEGVSVHLTDPDTLPLESGSIDIVISGQMLEHCEFFWRIFREMVRVLKEDGYIFLIAPSAGPIHDYPVDCYRFYPDAYRALAKYADCHLVDVWLDEKGPWNDLVGVFNKSGEPPNKVASIDAGAALAVNEAEFEATVHDSVKGDVPTHRLLETLHAALQPRSYLEIGVRHGHSLALAACEAVGVDPAPDIQCELPPQARIVRQSSDDFFEAAVDPILKRRPELIFIDGMHRVENALRDFMHAERISGPNTVIAIDDIFPNEPEQATRERSTRVWCGDVWKLIGILQKHRPDLRLILLDTAPTGLLLIAGLDRRSRILWQNYNPIVRQAVDSGDPPDRAILNRDNALDPAGPDFEDILQSLTRPAGKQPAPPAKEPKLSVVVIAHEMARELPRTLRSLSPAMQIALDAEDYEIIVVDNGSKQKPFDREACAAIAPNIRFLSEESGSVSPVGAINTGIAAARGALVGVMIDGARMASPGLLNHAIQAAQIGRQAVIGSFAFHLGDEIQSKSVQTGYDQRAEDALLASIEWEKDGYRLFDISVFASSSKQGWFALPAETNALFMHKSRWRELGGYDPRFEQPGGGLANLDMWHRACMAAGSEVIMLLGEGTFHQFHGGVATNSAVSKFSTYNAEYAAIRGHDYQLPPVTPKFYGSLRPNQLDGLAQAARAPNEKR
ncbi:methyltransferase domain-containing protein [Parasphingopyxis marina]|uniref:Glycosyltransferase n=1 Tax=Parasphingopyxis marina TaxID=2761622 RepID=A0A842HU64_9SPHN|nr:methyltransferase domain-containing protein [Parasphingopyxis marina]MBC2777498.1 glycosyltransferase [Parasphingopyxis marina]